MHWRLRVWPCVLQGCRLCSQQDSRCPSKASGLVRAIASCLQAVCRLPRRCCMDGSWSMLLIWGLHTYRCICTVRLVSLFLCVRLSLQAVSVLLNASTPGMMLVHRKSSLFAPCSELVPLQQPGGFPCIHMMKHFWVFSGPFGSKM